MKNGVCVGGVKACEVSIILPRKIPSENVVGQFHKILHLQVSVV